MNTLPDDIQNTIYRQKHNLDFVNCLNDINVINSKEQDYFIVKSFDYTEEVTYNYALFNLLHHTFYINQSTKRRHIQQTYCLLIDVVDFFIENNNMVHCLNSSPYFYSFIKNLTDDILTNTDDYGDNYFKFNRDSFSLSIY